MIKLIDILKEIVGGAGGIWYHGSTADIDQKDLDPLYRQNKGKGAMNDKLTKGCGRTGSSDNGTGIYFGKTKEGQGMESPMSYTGFDCIYDKQGFMYEMKLKPDAKVERKTDLHAIYPNAFKEFRQEGIDVFTNGLELNVLNPDVIDYFKKIMQWKTVPALSPLIRGKAQIDQMVTFNDDQELLNYLKKELGDYRLVKTSDNKQLYQPTDDDINKVFQYSSERKWFNV